MAVFFYIFLVNIQHPFFLISSTKIYWDNISLPIDIMNTSNNFNKSKPASFPSHNDIISKSNIVLTAKLQQILTHKQSIHFMPNKVEDAIEYGAPTLVASNTVPPAEFLYAM